MIYFHRQYIIFFFQVGRQFILERYISVRTPAQQLAIQPHLTVFVNAIKINKHLITGLPFIQRKSFSIPGDATGKETGSTGPLITEWSFDAPVVGKVHLSPIS